MPDAIYATQQAITTALTNSTEVQSMLGNPVRLYDHLPPSATFPYVVFGPTHVTPFDTKTEIGFETIVTLNIWSRYRGSQEVQDVFQALYDTLHRAPLSVANEILLTCEFHSADLTPDSDGLTFQGTARFSVITQTT